MVVSFGETIHQTAAYLPQTHVISKDARDTVLVETSHPGDPLELVFLQFSSSNELRLPEDARIVFVDFQFDLLPSRGWFCFLPLTFALPGTGSIFRIRVTSLHLNLALTLQSQVHPLSEQLSVGGGLLQQKFQASPAIDVIFCFLAGC